MSDQHRADILGCAGDPVVRTPHLDELAAEGVRFASAYCQGPLCMPARASFLTELYVRDHGLNLNGWDTPLDLPTFVSGLSDVGYHTSCIGKMHLWVYGARPTGGRATRDTRERAQEMRAYGFDEPIETTDKLATIHITSEYSDYLTERGLYETYQNWTAERRYAPETVVNGRTIRTLPLSTASSNPVTGDDYIDTWLGRRVVQWIEEYDRPEPFFQWVGFPGPHDPWDAPEDHVDRYRHVEMPLPGSYERPQLPPDGPFRAFLEYFMGHCDSPNLTDEAIAEIRRFYYANVSVIDDAIGEIIGALDRRGLLDNTWVIYTTDHGEMMGEHRMLTKMVFYEPAVKVPLIIRPPSGCDPRVVDQMVEHLDVSATIRAIGGAAAMPGAGGQSLLGWMDGGQGFSRPAVFSENFGWGMVRTPTHKLVFSEEFVEPVQLFDLAVDPLEDSNVVASTEQSDAREMLMEELVAPFVGNATDV